MSDYRYIFGLVPSRRFGRSLGVDLTPLKTCSTEAVRAELVRCRDEGGQTDYDTLSGSGEPTLQSRFGEVLRFAKQELRLPAVLLTNGTILEDCSEEFRSWFDRADLVIAKGPGNYETLSDANKNIYFLFTVKCPLVAARVGEPVGLVVKGGTPSVAILTTIAAFLFLAVRIHHDAK